MTTASISDSRKRVLIVGGGFGGVKAALLLSKAGDLDVTLLSDNPYFSYHPALYHTATGGRGQQSRIALAKIFAGKAVTIAEGKAVTLDRKARRIETADGKTYEYDKLVLALGMVANYFGIPGIAEHSYGIKSFEEAQRFKKHLHDQLAEGKKLDDNYVVVGGGPTGIELAGALPGYLCKIMAAHGVHGSIPKVSIVEAMPQLVPRMPAKMAAGITHQLERLGIKLYLGKAVKGQTATELQIDGEAIPTQTVVWTAGQANAPFFKDNGFVLNEKHKVVVDGYLQAEPDVYVLGDNNNTEFSGMAQTALHDAGLAAHNIIRETHGQPLQTYTPKAPVYVFPAGPHWAAVLWGKTQLYGWSGWVLRSLADLVAFHDIMPWPSAVTQWRNEMGGEEICPVCCKN